tara:strand:+ start:1604 stop:3565 length:1962 start_codon:yes stop_codon:yes gene_type:complete
MMQESLINSPLLAGLAITLIHFLWQGVLVALVLKILLSLISYKKSQLRYALSSMAMLANLILPAVTFFIIYDIEYRQVANFVHALPLVDQSLYLEQIQANVWYIEWLEYLPVLAMLWLAIVFTLALKLTIELYNVNKLPTQGCTTVDLALQVRFEGLINKVGLSRKVVLLVSSKTNVPMAIGWLKPIVLIPFSMLSGLSPQQLDMLLLHELAHIRRHDYLVNFLQTLVEILLFFHPAVSWVSKQMRNEREYCSDDIAVQHSGSPLAYAHTLADTASLCQKHRHHTIPNMAMAASGGDLKQRVMRLLDQQHCTKSTDSGKWLASCTVLLAIVFLFSKYSLTLPIIDLQSGSISIQNSPKTLRESLITYAPLTFQPVQSNTSLASQLLAIEDSNNRQESIANSRDVSLQQAIKKDNAFTVKAPLDKSKPTNEHKTTAYYNELPIVRANTDTKKNTNQHHAELTSQTHTSDNLNSNSRRTKSMSEIAFERTDSKNTTIKANPYAQQLASLLTEPKVSQYDKIAALNKTHDGIDQQSSVNQINKNGPNQAMLADKASKVLKLNPTNIAAKLISSVEPKYPSSAKRKGIELEIMVKFNIDKNGLVKDLQFESKSRSKASYFRNTIRNAMEEWRFLPAKKNGQVVESKMSKIFSFSLLS